MVQAPKRRLEIVRYETTTEWAAGEMFFVPSETVHHVVPAAAVLAPRRKARHHQ
jgi:hypothetical protein